MNFIARWYHRMGILMGIVLVVSVVTPLAWAQRSFTVVLDAGHGGKDPGAVGNGAREKDITLAVVKRLGKLISSEHSGVRVLYTRDKDVFIGLQQRADFANRNKASLFISVHVNSTTGRSAKGTETYVLGMSKQSSNLSVAMRENQAILLEDDYKTRYQGFDPRNTESYIMFDLMQEAYLSRSIDMANYVERQYKRLGLSSRGVRQDGFWVLSQSAMPSILTEIGFISNPSDAAYLSSDKGQSEIASALARAFTAFYRGAEGNTGRASTSVTDTAQTAEEVTAEAESVPAPSRQASSSRAGSNTSSNAKAEVASTRGSVYRVQFMTSPDRHDTKDKQFAHIGKPVTRTKEGKYYVYTVGETKSLDQARKTRKEIARHYKDCFIVEYCAGKRIGRVR